GTWRAVRDLAPSDRVHRAGGWILYHPAGDRGDPAEDRDASAARGGPAGSGWVGGVRPGSRSHPPWPARAPGSLRKPVRRTWIVRRLLIGLVLGRVGFAVAQSVPQLLTGGGVPGPTGSPGATGAPGPPGAAGPPGAPGINVGNTLLSGGGVAWISG